MNTQHILSSVSQGLRPRCMRPFVEIVCASYVEVSLFVFCYVVRKRILFSIVALGRRSCRYDVRFRNPFGMHFLFSGLRRSEDSFYFTFIAPYCGVDPWWKPF